MKKTFTIILNSKPIKFKKNEFTFMSDVWLEDSQWEDFLQPLVDEAIKGKITRESIVFELQTFIVFYERGYRACRNNINTNSETICDPESPF